MKNACNSVPEALDEATMLLQEVLGLGRGEVIALIGAGGKTTTLFRLARELREAGGKILVTTTTKIFKPTKPHIDRLFLIEDVNALLSELAPIPAPVTIGAGYRISDEDKLIGLPSEWLDSLHGSGQFDAILIEADGAASRGFKIPSETEPVVPKSCSMVIWTMAIKILGKPWDSNAVHRVERAIALLGLEPNTPITQEQVVALVKHPLGCLKGIPAYCRRIALINQADTPEETAQARELARLIAPLGFERVIITSYLSDPPVKDVVLPPHC
jgi:probable selenium-dependent hydroxylase accessory protein YqeC